MGDDVRIEVLDESEKTANLMEILPRKNELIRPAVSNVDQAMVIFAMESPKPNGALLDRFLIMMEKQKVPVGTVLLLSGKLTEVEGPRNGGEFDSRQYYACRHIYYFLKDAKIIDSSAEYSRYGQFLADLKSHFANVLAETAGEAAGVFTAVALGDKSALEEETKLRYQMAGILHILAISGVLNSIFGIFDTS